MRLRFVGIGLIVAGVAGFSYSESNYKEGRGTSPDPIGAQVRDRQTVNLPMWGTLGAIVLGSFVLMSHHRQRIW